MRGAADRAAVPEILQDQFAIASAAEYPALQTYGVTTCVAVTLYDVQLHQGALLHVSASTKIPEALRLVLEQLKQRGTDPADLQAQLWGGWGDSLAPEGLPLRSKAMVQELLASLAGERIRVAHNSTLVEKSDVDKGAPALLNVELDLSSGSVYLYQQTIPYGGVSPAQPLPGVFGEE